MTSYVLNDQFLAEPYLSGRVVYGRWDWVFGCWRADTLSGPLQAIVPTWRLLTSAGTAAMETPRFVRPTPETWRPNDFAAAGLWPLHALAEAEAAAIRITASDGSEVNSTAGGSARASAIPSPGALAACHGYVALIPDAIRRLAGPFGIHQFLLLDAIWADPGFLQFAQTAYGSGRASFITSCWALAEAHLLDFGRRRVLNRAIMAEKRLALLSRLGGVPIQPATLRSLYKIDPARIGPTIISRLNDLASLPPIVERLGRAQALTPGLIDLIADLPSWLALPNLIAGLYELEADEGELPSDLLRPRCFRTRDPARRRRIVDTIKRARNGYDLREKIDGLTERLKTYAPFPPPPVLSGAGLVPLDSSTALSAAACTLRNCADDFSDAIRRRRSYFYLWTGSEKGMVELVRLRPRQWTISRFAGRANRPLALQTIGSIVAALLPGAANEPAGQGDATAAPSAGAGQEQPHRVSTPAECAQSSLPACPMRSVAKDPPAPPQRKRRRRATE